MAHDLTPCPRRNFSRACVRQIAAGRCIHCGRELPLSHPTVISDPIETDPRAAAELLARPDVVATAARIRLAQGAVQAASVTCPACGFEGASESPVVPGMSCPGCGAVFRRIVSLRDPEGKLVAARRIKRALLAEADRAAGIDTSYLGGRAPMPEARLAWFREQAGRALSLQDADELISALPELLDEVDRLRRPQRPTCERCGGQLGELVGMRTVCFHCRSTGDEPEDDDG